MPEEVVIGRTVLGRPIEAVRFDPVEYAKPRAPAVLFGAIHGDEPTTVLMLERLIDDLVERPPGRLTWIVPCVNVDGTLAGTKNNANDIDLNRNFAASNWRAEHKAGYSPGERPESEPETRALVDLIEHAGATRLIALHATFRCINWDGTGAALAKELSALCGYEVSDDLGYPTPGSFGSKYGIDRGCEVITYEVPYLEVDERSWTENRSALRWVLDIPT